MEFPIELRLAIQQQLEGCKQSQLKQIAKDLSDRYMNESGTGKKLLTKDIEAAVYAAVRMPATFGAVSDALQYALEVYDGKITSLLDAGAGSGAASWAAEELLSIDNVICLERQGAMRKIGEALMRDGADGLRNARWISADLTAEKITESADLVIASYVMNEMAETDRKSVFKKLWDVSGKMLLIVEPGTPAGFSVIKEARETLLKMGAHIAAPCPHESPCRIGADDWCHFTCRVQRSKLHKLLKDGDVPYEDEKYAYIAFVKEISSHVQSRILRHPQIDKGQVRLEVCGATENKTITVRKKDGQLFKAARKAKCGDGIDI